MRGLDPKPYVFAFAWAVFFVVLLALVPIWGTENWAYSDHANYHIPYVNVILDRKLSPFGESMSATAPGAHLVLAMTASGLGMDQVSPDDTLVLIFNLIIASAALLLLYISFYALSKDWVISAIALMPVFSSQYFLLPSVYFVTEGLTHLCLALALLLTTLGAATRPALTTITALCLSLIVVVRQIFLPASFVWIGLLCLRGIRARTTRIWHAALLVAAPVLAFLPFVYAWGGLVPPEFTKHEDFDLNLSALLNGWALLGLFSLPLLRLLWTQQSKHQALAIAAVSLAGSVCAMLFISADFNAEQGRFGSLIWQISSAEVRLYGSPVIPFVLFFFGIFALLSCFSIGDRLLPIPVSTSYLVYSLALMMQSYAWQRYSEIFALLLISLAATNLLRVGDRIDIAGFMAFYFLFFVGTLVMRVQL